MSAENAVIVIDSQLYIDLYRTKTGKELLGALQQVKAHIFITEQIVNEVNRNKLQATKKFFNENCQIGKPAGCPLPDHLFDDSGTIVQGIREKLNSASDKVKEATRDFETAIAETLRHISRSEDVVSRALEPLFAKAVANTPEEFERAKERKARGIPPGKQGAPVGDELNWEQFTGFVKATGKKSLWIISRDSDYCVEHKQAAFLIPTLHQELMRLADPPPEVRAFTIIPDGIKDFSDVTGINVDKLPTPERVKEIKKEQDELPPLEQSHEAASAVLRNPWMQHGIAAFFAAVASDPSGWHPGMMEEGRAIISHPPPPSENPVVPPRPLVARDPNA
jgi:PIN domain